MESDKVIENEIERDKSVDDQDLYNKTVWKKRRGGYSSFQEIELENTRLEKLYYLFRDQVKIKADSNYFSNEIESHESENQRLRAQVLEKACKEESFFNKRIGLIWEKYY